MEQQLKLMEQKAANDAKAIAAAEAQAAQAQAMAKAQAEELAKKEAQ